MLVVHLLYSISNVRKLPPISKEVLFIRSLLYLKCIQHDHETLEMFQIDPI